MSYNIVQRIRGLQMYKRIFVSLLLVFCCRVLSGSPPAVKTIEKAVACPDIADFGPFFKVQFESKGTIHPVTAPPKCILVEQGTSLNGPLDTEIREFYGHKHRFFRVKSPADQKQQLWIPDFSVSKPTSNP